MNILKNLIVFEGLDGAGTTTQSKLLSNKIKNSFHTCEPTNENIGKFIRSILKNEIKVDPLSLAYLFAADRAEHIYGQNGIIEKCKNGNIVISDRYFFSSLAYLSLDVSFEKILEINKDFPLPEIIFFLNTSPDICQQRIKLRSGIKELFEDENIQNQILENYLKGLKLFENSGSKIYKIDGNLQVEEILNEEIKLIGLSNLYYNNLN